MKMRKGFTLRFVISVLVVVSVLLTAIVIGYSAYNSIKQTLTSNYEKNNLQYAKKLSSETSALLKSMETELESISTYAKNNKVTQYDIDLMLKANSHYFNSIFIANENRILQKASPENQGFQPGLKINTDVAKHVIKLKKPFVSDPYIATTGRLIVLVSYPIFDPKGSYKGYVGGTIYLEEENVLSNMLREHFFGDGSYVYVVDKAGKIIFHPDKKRINEGVLFNPVVKKVISGQSGSQQVRNSKGIDFFVGYTVEPTTGWGIVSQTPIKVLNEPLKELIVQIVLRALPLFILIIAVSWWITLQIARPLHSLARYSEEAIVQRRSQCPNSSNINSSIYEVRQLYRHINNHLNVLHHESRVDGLTGLSNRRTFERVGGEMIQEGHPFSLILLDADNFKKVNDTFGHLIGDEVLIFLASKMNSIARDGDLPFRYGGEEFGILVNDGDVEAAMSIAEELRNTVEQGIGPNGISITISLGIATYQKNEENLNEIIERADFALYQSKSNGKNKTTVFVDSQIL
ncbi:sensor domain-containing diguanylate cyclase [Peribacillus alkalitolerans]|uniref:sensor domain-containing diguanylate cyclase n=1 Tax=Peribacillus alkalitolerans TaxID=1550385 RepID=UPI0013D64C43|nr:sensor domain-containing diguanylate cyclase [Peribacillus alkalitolerans]